MPLHRNKSAGQKTLTLKSEEAFAKENYMLSRERVTCFIQLWSNPKVDLKPEFIFKGKGTRIHLTPPEGVNYQWVFISISKKVKKICFPCEKFVFLFSRLFASKSL